MGKISEYIAGLVAKQVKDNGIVVWYDPDQVYTGVIDKLTIPATTVLQYEDSFFGLRAQIEPFLEFIDEDGRPRPECEVPPRLVVYVSKARSETDNALIETEQAGVVMEPGANPWQKNTRLRVIAEQVFKKITPDSVQEIRRQIDEGILSLDDLDRLSQEAEGIATGTVKLLFGTADAVDVTLAVASSTEHDEAILTKKALPEINVLLDREMGIVIPPKADLLEARKTIIRTLLLTELVSSLKGEKVPDALRGVDLPKEPRHIEKICHLCSVWRHRTDYRDAYITAAKAVEGELALSSMGWPADALKELSTFPFIEKTNLGLVEDYVLQSQFDHALALAEKRKDSFWVVQDPVQQLHRRLIENCARILSMVQRIEEEGKPAKAEEMVERYAAQGLPWYHLDAAYRHLEAQYSLYELDVMGEDRRLEQTIARVRQAYTHCLQQLSDTFTDLLIEGDFHIQGFLHQSEIFKTHVEPLLRDKEKTAYVLVDALRYEMGEELVDGLQDEFEVFLEPGIAQTPTITTVGMAALMPEAENGMELLSTQGGKLAVQIGSTVIKDRSGRMKHLEQASDGKFVSCKLGEIIKPSKKRQDEIHNAGFVVVTSQEIDRLGEGSEEEEVRLYMDEILEKLRRGIRRLASLGVANIVVTADHGHLFGETIESGMKMDPPGGKTIELHRRVWVGKGGAKGDGYFRVKASQLGLGGDLELAFPRSLACFKAKGGSTAYFHGGMSLQEVVIPVIVLKKKETKPFTAKARVVELTLSKPKISTRFFSLSATYFSEALFEFEQVRVKIFVKSRGKDCGFAAMAAYGFEEGTREIVLRKEEPNAITLMIPETKGLKSISVRVADASNQVELAKLENIPVDVAI
jgi:hypothetical protein